MSYLAQYGEACDYVRGYLDLKPDVSIQELLVKLTEAFRKLKDSQPEALELSPACFAEEKLCQTQELKPKQTKQKKKSQSKSQRLQKLKRRHSAKKDLQTEKKI